MAAHSFVSQPHPLRREVLLLLQVAMLVFVWTVVIGILNGTDLVDFSRKTVLSHVHAGTLGWITMCVFAATLWLFGAGATSGQVRSARVLALAAIITLPAFALTFAITFGEGRAVMGSLALATIVGFFLWVLLRLRSVELTTVHLGFLAAVATSVAGGTIGVLLATRIATGRDVIPSGASDAHPATMVIGFLVPVGMALAEWAFGWPNLRKATRLGTAQMAFPFAGGLLLMISLLFEITPLAPIAALIELAGVVIFIIRNLGSARALDWMAASPGRFAAAAGVAIVANILFINYLAAKYSGDFNKVPDRQLLALDHTMFVGVLTNAVFGLLYGLTRKEGRGTLADQVIFVGLNLGLVGFVISLLGDLVWLERVSTPLMGASILTGLAVYTLRLTSREATETLPGAIAADATAG